MKWYKRIYLTFIIIMSIPAILFTTAGIGASVLAEDPGARHHGLLMIAYWLWHVALMWGGFIYLVKGRRFNVIASIIPMVLIWCPLLIRTIGRILFIQEHGGMERSDGHGSPGAFFFAMVFEQLYLIPSTILIAFGIFILLRSNHSLQSTVD